MKAITAIIPTFNEEANIGLAIASVSFADEILVVDSYSNDKTLEIAKSMGAKIIQRVYENSASQKNWAIPQAKHKWIVLLDADEIVSNELKIEIQTLLKKDIKESGFWIYRENFFLGKKIKYSGWQSDKVIRLFKRDECRYEIKRVHAEIISKRKIGFLKNKLVHNTYKNFDHYLSKIEQYAKWQSEDLDEKKIKLNPFQFILKPPLRFIKHYIIQKGFLDGSVGFIIAVLQSYGVMLRYIYLLKKRTNNDGRN